MILLRTSFLPAFLLLATCAVPDNPTRSSATGATEIQVRDGKNCWDNDCFTFSRANRSVSVPGKYPVRAPRDIDLRDGYVSAAEFASMFQTANMAYATGVGRR